jgi:hypothetical protein
MARLALPGTHDSYAMNCGGFMETQVWTVPQQLRAGIRFLDIRLRSDMGVYHGLVYLDVSWKDVCGHVAEFLAAFPSETVVVRVKMEGGGSSNAVKCEGPLFGTSTVLGPNRGKMVLLDENAGGVSRFRWGDMRVLDDYIVWAVPKWMPCIVGVPLSKKLRRICKWMRAGGQSNEWTFIFLSGSVGLLPGAVASVTNEQALRDIENGLGRGLTLIMDFPGLSLIRAIINSN